MDSKTQKVFKRTHISSSTEIQELDRKDGEEKITEANRDARIRHDVRREAENIPRHQTAPHKGSDCVKMRGSRVAQVCLVLLCAALLTVVIVLAVSLHNMIEEFYIKNKNLTDEIDHLSKRKSILEENNKKLLNNEEILDKNKQQIQEDIQNLEKLKQSMEGWRCYQSSLYFFSSEEKSWTESRRYCTDNGANLTIINNQQEQDFVKSISNDQSFWIGLTDSGVEGSWKWIDGTNVTSGFSFWKNGQPGSYKANDEDCAATDSSGWAAYYCSRGFKWICEKNFEEYQNQYSIPVLERP